MLHHNIRHRRFSTTAPRGTPVMQREGFIPATQKLKCYRLAKGGQWRRDRLMFLTESAGKRWEKGHRSKRGGAAPYIGSRGDYGPGEKAFRGSSTSARPSCRSNIICAVASTALRHAADGSSFARITRKLARSATSGARTAGAIEAEFDRSARRDPRRLMPGRIFNRLRAPRLLTVGNRYRRRRVRHRRRQ